MCTAVILTGGQGRRMGGQPKPLLPVGSKRIIDQQLTILRAVADPVVIVTSDDGRYDDLGAPVWADLRPGCGPLGGILTALTNAPTSIVLVVAGDMPFLTTAFLRHLIAEARGVDVAIPCAADGYQPLCAVYSRACVPSIRRQIAEGIFKVTELLPSLKVREIGPTALATFDPDDTLFFNINTPDDYTHSLRIAERRNP